MLRRSHRGLVLAAVLGAACSEATGDASTGDEQTRATMGEIFAALSTALPPSLNDERFRDPALRASILASLQRLAANGERLEAHGRSRDASFSVLSRSLARDAREIERRFAEGRTSEARFLLHELTQTCVACHSRLPGKPSSLSERFVERADVASLSLDERARLEMATRQFSRAVESYEALLASPGFSPDYLDLAGHLDDYLELTLRVRDEPGRAIPVLRRFSARSDTSARLRGQVDAWIASLQADDEEEAVPQLETARRLIREAEEDTSRFPDERAALAQYVRASSLLHRYVADRPVEGRDVAEAYYLLGLIEARVGRAFWLSQTEALLETAIRLAPGEPFAGQAYQLLEEFLVSGYAGSSGEHVPPEEKAHLAELRRLIDAAGDPS